MTRTDGALTMAGRRNVGPGRPPAAADDDDAADADADGVTRGSPATAGCAVDGGAGGAAIASTTTAGGAATAAAAVGRGIDAAPTPETSTRDARPPSSFFGLGSSAARDGPLFPAFFAFSRFHSGSASSSSPPSWAGWAPGPLPSREAAAGGGSSDVSFTLRTLGLPSTGVAEAAAAAAALPVVLVMDGTGKGAVGPAAVTAVEEEEPGPPEEGAVVTPTSSSDESSLP